MDIEITPAETAVLLSENRAKLLDVRTPEEYQIAKIEGAILVDQQVAQEILQTWPKDTRIITICHHGVRSLNAASFLQASGFENVQSMRGGIDSWSITVDPTIPRY